MAVSKTYGHLVDRTEEGDFVADITRPERISGVVLPVASLCLTRSYPNPKARVKITDIHCPTIGARVGDEITAQLDVTTERTGRTILNPNRGWNQPYYIDETETIGAAAVKWGLVEN